MARTVIWAVMLGYLAVACHQPANEPTREPRTGEFGAPKTLMTRALELGSKLFQRNAPTAGLTIYLVAFHPLKDNPQYQMEAHHYCRQLNEDLAQCALYDGNTVDSHLNGIEYIISERLFEQLPEEERHYWHPHNYELLSGLLRAPGLPAFAEMALMKSKMNSYGKTWHTWHTGGNGAALLPLGDPHLAWSFNADGELRPEILAERDRAMGLDTAKTRQRRQSLVPLAHPQHGVDVLAPAFPGRDTPPGVTAR